MNADQTQSISHYRFHTLFIFVLVSFAAASAEWQKVNVPTNASLRGLSVVSDKVVWASGTEGTVIRTVDGGKNWSVITVPGAEKLDFRGIRAFDKNNAVIISSGPAEKGQARIYRTSDGGKTWRQVLEEHRVGIFFDAVAFWDRHHGLVLSDPVDGHFVLFRTDDGGESWKQIAPDVLPPALANEGSFAASNSCLTVQGAGNAWFATGGASTARVFKSRDRGESWAVADTPMHPANSSSGIFSVAFQDARNGVVVGGDYAHPAASDLPNMMFTTDGGQSWQVGSGTQPQGMYLSSVIHLPGVGVDPGGFVAVGTKGALSLRALPAGGYPAMGSKTSEMELNTVGLSQNFHPAPVVNLWSVGPKGTVVHQRIPWTGM